MIKNMILATMAAGFLATSCSSDDDNNNGNTGEANLSLNLEGLERLGNGYVYEGWVIVNDTPRSTGVFTVNAEGELSQTEFQVNQELLDNATRFVLSIEPEGETGEAALTPADTKLLVGDFSDDSATLNTDIVGDFSDATGRFFLRTPTDETNGNNGNDQYGVWFGVPGMPPTPSLSLPTLPAGWVYEGWVIGESGPLSTGTFADFNTPDDNADNDQLVSFSATSQAGPNIPGEDFFMNAPEGEMFPLDVRGRTVVVSVEPVPDDSPAPFVLKPLLGPAGLETAPISYTLNQNLGTFPSGSVTRK